MKLGDIVALKGNNVILGEVIEIDDYDRVTITLAGIGIDINVVEHICNLEVIEEAEGDE